jgi:hypothetical protein
LSCPKIDLGRRPAFVRQAAGLRRGKQRDALQVEMATPSALLADRLEEDDRHCGGEIQAARPVHWNGETVFNVRL